MRSFLLYFLNFESYLLYLQYIFPSQPPKNLLLPHKLDHTDRIKRGSKVWPLMDSRKTTVCALVSLDIRLKT